MQAAQFVSFLCLLHVVVAYHRPLRPEPSTFRAAAAPGDALSSAGVPTDLVLSSGFCAFARQAGVLAALQDFNIQVDRCVGTSSGSLAASMFAAGMTPLQIADELSRQRPIALCQPSLRVHRGAFSLRGLVAHLRTLLPKDFDQLEHKLAVGVYETSSGVFRLVDDGDLPAAVAASCAIPYVFQPVMAGSPPVLMADGGVKDRLGLAHWAAWAGASASAPRRAVVHLVGTSSKKAKMDPNQRLRHEVVTPADTPVDYVAETESVEKCILNPSPNRHRVVAPPHASLFVVRTPKADASLFSLRDFEAQRMVAYGLAAQGFVSPDYATFAGK